MPRLVLVLVLLACSAAWAGGPQRLWLQKGVRGDVIDSYVWEEAPTYNGNGATLYSGLVGSSDKMSFLRFDLSEIPDRALVYDARLVLTSDGSSGVPMVVRRVAVPWTETQPTWATFASALLPGDVATFTPALGRVEVPLTGLVQKWVDGTANDGVALLQATRTASTTFVSSDATVVWQRPALEVFYLAQAPLVDPEAGPVALEAACGVPFSYGLRADAPEASSFTLAAAPEGLTLDPRTGDLRWTPTRAQAGAHEFSATVEAYRRSGTLQGTVAVRCAPALEVGCAAAPGGAWGLCALAWAALRRGPARRRAARSA